MSRAIIARVNRVLRANARKEQLVRGRDYYYPIDGDAHTFRQSGIYQYRFDTFEAAWSSVVDLFSKEGITLTKGETQ